MGTYNGKWNTVAGYLDELRPVREKVIEELHEEAGISEKDILRLNIYDHYQFTDNSINKTWIVCLVLVELNHLPDIILDWEHVEYKWILPGELKNFETVPKLDKGLKMILNSK